MSNELSELDVKLQKLQAEKISLIKVNNATKLRLIEIYSELAHLIPKKKRLLKLKEFGVEFGKKDTPSLS